MRIFVALCLFFVPIFGASAQSYAFLKADLGFGQNKTLVADQKEVIINPMSGAYGFSVPVALHFGYRYSSFALSTGIQLRKELLNYSYANWVNGRPEHFIPTSLKSKSLSIPVRLEYHRPIYLFKALELFCALHGELSFSKLLSTQTYGYSSSPNADPSHLVLLKLKANDKPSYSAGLSLGLVNEVSERGAVAIEARYMQGFGKAFEGTANYYKGVSEEDALFIINNVQQDQFFPNDIYGILARNSYTSFSIVYQMKLIKRSHEEADATLIQPR